MGPSMALVLHGGVGGVRWCFVAPLVGCPLHAYLLTYLLACLLAGWLACLLACLLSRCFSGLFLSLFDFFLAGEGDVATKTELCGKTAVTPPK